MMQLLLTGLLCGGLLGFVMQRGRFCVTGAFRDMYVTKDYRMFIAFLLAITVQSIGVFLLHSLGVIEFQLGNFMWFATISGAFIFGIGIILAGGCATGTWYRAGEGLIGSWIALFTYMVSSAMMKSGIWQPATASMQSHQLEAQTIHGSLGVSPWVLVAVLAVITAFFVWKQLSKPSVKIPTMKPKKTGIAHLLFEKRWHPFVTATLIGLIAILAWPLSEATGRMFGLGITTPTANLLQYAISGDSSFLNWGVFLVLGILIGSYIAAKGSGEFRFRTPDAGTCLKSAGGGILMGIGASLAGGCSIGNGLVETALFTWQGWISLPFMILGTWTGAYFTIIRPRQKAAKQAKVRVQTA
ncbi:YeeE/YedE family protein [Bacillus xiapuensis]|uniref:YeeE/YedE family protein n=1 Tax=Bacillus xiapuensis TaxID=2014075 RepID=UPI000C2386BA|nr:YeeE/YedE family protein [Bacillus xiapuensis]